MRFAKIVFVALCICALGANAYAADQTFAAHDAGNVLHGVDGRTYWEMFAVCFASTNAVLEKAALENNEAQQREMGELAAAVLERGIVRLVADRVVFEGEAEEVFYARAVQFTPIANFADACRLYIKDHDARFGAPK
jgi:hypothetical protein